MNIKQKRDGAVIISHKNIIKKKTSSNVNGACRHMWMWRSCQSRGAHQAGDGFFNWAVIHSLTDSCYRGSSGVNMFQSFHFRNQHISTHSTFVHWLFALFNIIKKKKRRDFSFLFCISCFDSDLFVGFAKLSKPLLSFFNRALFDYVFPIFSPSHLVFSLFSLSISQYSLFIFFGSDLLFFWESNQE